jgi:hypothetical protein
MEIYNRRDMGEAERWIWVFMSINAFALLFLLTWFISSLQPLSHTFRKFDFKNKCDWCSRVPSVVHANLVLWFLWREHLYNVVFDEAFQTQDDLYVLERNMCISAGYFLYDFCVIVISKMDLWPLYIFHHLAALWPLLSVLFNGCQNYTYFGSGYFFVEMTIFPLQLVHWGETLKHPNSWWVSLGYHVTFWLWIPFRLVLPVYMTYNGVGVVMPQDDTVGFWQCKVPVGQGGVNIWLFCWLVFFAHIMPAYVKRLRGRKPTQRQAPAQLEKLKKPPVKPPGAKASPPMSPVGSPQLKTTS